MGQNSHEVSQIATDRASLLVASEAEYYSCKGTMSMN